MQTRTIGGWYGSAEMAFSWCRAGRVIGKDDPGYRHACGRACTLRATERFMETGNLTLEAVPV